MLEEVLSVLHEELGLVVSGVMHKSVLCELVEISWTAAVAAMTQLALHQAGFRPLLEEVRPLERPFLPSLSFLSVLGTV